MENIYTLLLMFNIFLLKYNTIINCKGGAYLYNTKSKLYNSKRYN